MADTAVTQNVFIDTEVFDHHSRDFQSANLRILRRLGASEKINLFLTEITKHEVCAHIDSDGKEAFKRLQNYKRVSRAVKRIIPDPKLEPEDEGAIQTDLQKEFEEFIKDSKIEILSVDDVAAGPIFKKYFKQRPPFGDKNKKSEFPDAFALAALEQWCKRMSAKMYVVSGDRDWRRTCKANANLLHIGRLDELLEKFGDSIQITAVKEALSKVWDHVVEDIERDAYNLDFFVSDNLVDGEAEDIEIEVEVGDPHVVEANNGKAVVSVPCTLNITASVTAMDPDSMWTDPDTKDLNSVWQLRGSVEHETDRSATMEVAYDANNTDKVGVKNVRFEDRCVEFDVDERELSCSDEDELADFDVPEDPEPEP
jgi:hypothetical protein